MECRQDRNEDRGSIWHKLSPGSGTAVDRQNNRKLTAWCIAWAAAILGATWIVQSYQGLPPAIVWLIALMPNVFAIGALFAYLRYLRMADEMQRRIQLEGLAIGFGTGWIFAVGYQVLQAAGAPDIPITTMILVMTIGWIGGTIRAVRHYQ